MTETPLPVEPIAPVEAPPVSTPVVPAPPAPVEIQPDRLRPSAAKVAQLGDEGMQAWREHYEANGGEYFKAVEARVSEMESKMHAMACDKAISDAIVRYGLSPSDSDIIRGATPEDIEARAKLLAARPAPGAPGTPAPQPGPQLPQYKQVDTNDPVAVRDAVYGEFFKK